MIELQQPSLVLHSRKVPGYQYPMRATWTLPASSLVG